MKKEIFIISVGEPWNFESQDGQNIIKGNIINIRSNQCLVFKSNHYLQFEEIKSNILVLTPRHQGYDFSNFESNLIFINGGILIRKYDEQLSEEELLTNARFVIIGSVKKE